MYFDLMKSYGHKQQSSIEEMRKTMFEQKEKQKGRGRWLMVVYVVPAEASGNQIEINVCRPV